MPALFPLDFNYNPQKGGIVMPAYDYECVDCAKEFTAFQSIKEYEASQKVVCPHCGGSNVKRKFNGFFAKTSRKS
jgi:putative FmdB family regulatory protein